MCLLILGDFLLVFRPQVNPIAERKLPAWLIGIAVASPGLFTFFILTSVPILLAAKGVSVGRISVIVAIATSPGSWGLCLSPLLDILLSRRSYTYLLCAIAAICLVFAILCISNLAFLSGILLVGFLSAEMCGRSIEAWTSEFLQDDQVAAVAGWKQVARLAIGPTFGSIVVALIRSLPLAWTLLLLAALFVLPLVTCFFFPPPLFRTVKSREMLRMFWRDLYKAIGSKRCRYGMLVYLLPVACFALNFAPLGNSFHVSEKLVTIISGPLTAIASGIGALIGIWVCHKIDSLWAYVLPALLATIVTGGLIAGPKVLIFYMVGCFLYNLFQGISYTAYSTLMFEIVGLKNPLAATQFTLLTSLSNVPIVLLGALNGFGYSRFGLNGMLASDTLVTAMTGVLLLIFVDLSIKGNRRGAGRVDDIVAF